MTSGINIRDYKYLSKNGYWIPATREEWLKAILDGGNSPKPPESWLMQQGLEGRSRKTAAIIWGRNYDAGRKYVIWDQATQHDFDWLGYTI